MTEAAWPVWSAGRVLAPGEPVVRAQDPAFLEGLAVFETILVERGHPYFLGAHLERLARGARVLGLATGAEPAAGVVALARRVEAERFALRVTLGRRADGPEPLVVVTARPAPEPPAEGVQVLLSEARVLADELADVKTTSRLRYALAREAARARGAWDALVANERGDLAEGTISNVFLVRDRTVVTPALGEGCLGGVLRARLLAAWRDSEGGEGAFDDLRVALVPLDALLTADEVFLTNALAGIVPVRSLLFGDECRDLPGAAGPVAHAAAERLAALRARDRGVG